MVLGHSTVLMIITRQLAGKRLTALGLLLALYVFAHLALSRISTRLVSRDWGVAQGFFYVPVRPDFLVAHEGLLLPIHRALTVFFWPAWSLDHGAFGGPAPIIHYSATKPLPSP